MKNYIFYTSEDLMKMHMKKHDIDDFLYNQDLINSSEELDGEFPGADLDDPSLILHVQKANSSRNLKKNLLFYFLSFSIPFIIMFLLILQFSKLLGLDFNFIEALLYSSIISTALPIFFFIARIHEDF